MHLSTRLCHWLLVLSLSMATLAAQQATKSAAGEIYKQAAPSVVSIEGKDDKGTVVSTGTGFVVAPAFLRVLRFEGARNTSSVFA